MDSKKCIFVYRTDLQLIQWWFVAVHDENPSLAVVRKFVHLLDASDNDYAEELGESFTFLSST